MEKTSRILLNSPIKTKKSLLHRVIRIFVILIILAVVAMTTAIFIVEKKQEGLLSRRGKAETYSETFNINFLPDYTISADNEEKYNEKMVALLQKDGSKSENYSENEGAKLLPLLKPEEKIVKAKSDLKFLKEYYPEGYYLVENYIRNTPEEDNMFPSFYIRTFGDNDRVDIIVHEISHLERTTNITSCDSSGYVVEDKNIIIKKQADMPRGDELLKFISNPLSLDNKYLKENKQDIYTTLDEIVSYTKSVRVTRSLARYNKGVIDEDSTQSLSRQLYYLSLHLKNIKENHPNLWSTLKKEKAFAYIMSRMVSIAKTEIQAAKDEGVSGSTGTDIASSIDDNLLKFNENQVLFDELYTATGINSLGNLQKLSLKELGKIGVKIEKI